MSKPHALVTGGAGFIGSHLVDVLIARGFEVTVLDNLTPQVHADAQKDEDGWPIYLNRAARRIRGDILDDGVFEASLQGVTHLAHLAASVGVGQSMTSIAEYTRNNTLGAAIILDVLARTDHSVRRMAVASSMSIYGEGEYRAEGGIAAPDERAREQLAAGRWEVSSGGFDLEPVPTREAKPLRPASVYAINKRDHEEMFLVVGKALGIPTIALRLFNAYGSRQALSNPYTGVAAIFIARLLNDQPPLVFEDGRQRRDFVHVLDVAETFAAALEGEAPIWEAFNVGSGQSISIGELAATLARLLHKNIAPQVLNQSRAGDIRHCFADITKLERELGVRPKRRFEAGMEELIAWVREAPKPVDRGESCLAELRENRLVIG